VAVAADTLRWCNLFRVRGEATPIIAAEAEAPRAEPEVPGAVLQDAEDGIVGQAIRGGEILEGAAVVAVHTVLIRGEPQVVFTIFQDGMEAMLHQGSVGLEGGEALPIIAGRAMPAGGGPQVAGCIGRDGKDHVIRQLPIRGRIGGGLHGPAVLVGAVIGFRREEVPEVGAIVAPHATPVPGAEPDVALPVLKHVQDQLIPVAVVQRSVMAVQEAGHGASIAAMDPLGQGSEPQAAIPILQQAGDTQALQAVRLEIGAEGGARIHTDPRIGGDEDVAGAVLDDGPRLVVAQTVLRGELLERGAVVAVHALTSGTEPQVAGAVLQLTAYIPRGGAQCPDHAGHCLRRCCSLVHLPIERIGRDLPTTGREDDQRHQGDADEECPVAVHGGVRVSALPQRSAMWRMGVLAAEGIADGWERAQTVQTFARWSRRGPCPPRHYWPCSRRSSSNIRCTSSQV